MLNTESQLPLVTIITPAYNRASFLEETIVSVLDQNYPRLEYIVLDDGSTDDTLEVIRKYDGKLVWETHSNMGETRTVNKGFTMAHGEIIGVVNSDDPLLPDAVAKIINKFMEDRELLVVYPDWDMIDADGNLMQIITTCDYDYVNMLRWHHCVPGPGTFFRREVVEKTKGRDTEFRYVADFDFWLRAGLLGPFARIPERLATFRVHSDSASVSHQGTEMAEEHIHLVNKLFSQTGLPDTMLKIKRDAYSSAYYIAGCVCGDKLSNIKKKYFVLAICFAPLKYLTEYRERLFVILPEILGKLYTLVGCAVNFCVRIKKISKDISAKCQ